MTRLGIAFLLLFLAACGGQPGFRRPDYAAEAVEQCDEADATPDPHRALALYGMAIEADPKMPRAYLGRARVFEKTGRTAEAERSYSLAIEVASDDVRARFLLERALYLKRIRRIELSVRDLTRAIGLLDAFPDPETAAEARVLRAECRAELRDWPGAREDLDAADKMDLSGSQRERVRPLRIKVDAELPEKGR